MRGSGLKNDLGALEMADEIAVCPCGDIPTVLCVDDLGYSSKHARVSGNCCGEWSVEFRTGYAEPGSNEIDFMAREAWNAAPRGKK
jgi:hypothetical protein